MVHVLSRHSASGTRVKITVSYVVCTPDRLGSWFAMQIMSQEYLK